MDGPWCWPCQACCAPPWNAASFQGEPSAGYSRRRPAPAPGDLLASQTLGSSAASVGTTLVPWAWGALLVCHRGASPLPSPSFLSRHVRCPCTPGCREASHHMGRWSPEAGGVPHAVCAHSSSPDAPRSSMLCFLCLSCLGRIPTHPRASAPPALDVSEAGRLGLEGAEGRGQIQGQRCCSSC